MSWSKIHTSGIRVFPLTHIDGTNLTFETRKVETFSSTQCDFLIEKDI